MTKKQKAAVHDLLASAYNTIKDPKKWTQGSCAVNEHGHGVSVTDPEACQWCAVGATLKASFEQSPDLDRTPYYDAIDVLNQAATKITGWGVINTNDGVVHLETGERTPPRASRRQILKAFRIALKDTETA